MGRGRAKAKQTKVARQLKYGGPTTDLERLQAELAGSSTSESDHSHHADDSGESGESDEYSDYDDPYAKYIEGDQDEAEPEPTAG